MASESTNIVIKVDNSVIIPQIESMCTGGLRAGVVTIVIDTFDRDGEIVARPRIIEAVAPSRIIEI